LELVTKYDNIQTNFEFNLNFNKQNSNFKRTQYLTSLTQLINCTELQSVTGHHCKSCKKSCETINIQQNNSLLWN